MAHGVARTMQRVRLTRKLARILNGVDVSSLNIGDVLELPESAAAMLIAERWAEPVDDLSSINPGVTVDPRLPT